MCDVVDVSGVRIGWSDLPDEVRGAVESMLGGRVAVAVSQTGGFSPGTADRVVTDAGRRAFVKAVSPDLNEQSAELHRREARITAALPPEVPAARLIGSYDDGHWIALVLEDIDGRNPRWVPEDLSAVLAALAAVSRIRLPATLDDLPSTGELLAYELGGWHRIAADPPEGLDAWAARHLGQLCDAASRCPTLLGGHNLVHTDVRADNLLIRPDGSVVLVDWPWASAGPAWFDTLCLAINVATVGGPDAATLLEAPPLAQTEALAGMAGFFIDAARQPAPPGLPTLRAFQAAQGTVALELLRERLAEFGNP